jgi:palmitoyltransferase
MTYTFTEYYVLDKKEITSAKVILAFLFYFCLIMVLITHFLSTCRSPGFIDRKWREISQSPIHLIENTKEIKNSLFCNKCSIFRPERAHHCKICKRCVLKMDHHSPWIANCVGLKNQKLFYLFIFYSTCGNLIAFCSFLNKILEDDFFVDHPNVIKTPIDIIIDLLKPIFICFVALVALVMTILLGTLLFFYTKNILNDTTLIERLIFDSKENPFFIRSRIENFEIVMGNSIIKWFIPDFTLNPYNDGYSYRRSEHSNEMEQNIPTNTSLNQSYVHVRNLQLEESKTL